MELCSLRVNICSIHVSRFKYPQAQNNKLETTLHVNCLYERLETMAPNFTQVANKYRSHHSRAAKGFEPTFMDEKMSFGFEFCVVCETAYNPDLLVNDFH